MVWSLPPVCMTTDGRRRRQTTAATVPPSLPPLAVPAPWCVVLCGENISVIGRDLRKEGRRTAAQLPNISPSSFRLTRNSSLPFRTIPAAAATVGPTEELDHVLRRAAAAVGAAAGRLPRRVGCEVK